MLQIQKEIYKNANQLQSYITDVMVGSFIPLANVQTVNAQHTVCTLCWTASKHCVMQGTLLLLFGEGVSPAIILHNFPHTCFLIHLFPLVWAPTFCFLPTVLALRPTCSWVEMSGWAGTVSHFLFPACLFAFGCLPLSMSAVVCSQTGKRCSSGFRHVL